MFLINSSNVSFTTKKISYESNFRKLQSVLISMYKPLRRAYLPKQIFLYYFPLSSTPRVGSPIYQFKKLLLPSQTSYFKTQISHKYRLFLIKWFLVCSLISIIASLQKYRKYDMNTYAALINVISINNPLFINKTKVLIRIFYYIHTVITNKNNEMVSNSFC